MRFLLLDLPCPVTERTADAGMLRSKLDMPLTRPCCPSCHLENVVKDGRIYNGKQNHKCSDCGRQLVQDPLLYFHDFGT